MPLRNQNHVKGQTAPLILASASPRRAELLAQAGIRFQVIVSATPEPAEKPAIVPAELWPTCLAYMKAAAVRDQLSSRDNRPRNEIILAADTIVLLGEGRRARILNKPRDRGHARVMLRALSGKSHRVITGLALFQGERFRLGSATAVCRMKRLSPAALNGYLDTGLWRGKAGAYGIQDAHDPFVQLISGEFSTVVGLPMSLLQSEFATFIKE